MAFSLFDASVTNYIQILGSTAVVLDKGKAHASANGVNPDDLLNAKLADDMLPLRFQMISTAHHSLGAIEGLRAGVFNPPPQYPDLGFDGLLGLINNAKKELEKVSADEINGMIGQDMMFEMGDFKVPFTAEGFVMSFSLPNFYFHATTVYDILRVQGTPLGKMDFLGAMQIKQ